MDGGPCEFMMPDAKCRLRPVCFGSRKCRGKESKLHSHLGEGFCGDWAINKNRARLYGRRFTWITDCHALRFIMTYDGPNPVLLRLQMRFMMWSMDIIHRIAKWLTDADYFSRCGTDLCFDPLYSNYLRFTIELRKLYPPVSGPMQAANMPGFRGPRVHDPPTSSHNAICALSSAPVVDNIVTPIILAIYVENSRGHICLSTVPVVFTEEVITPLLFVVNLLY